MGSVNIYTKDGWLDIPAIRSLGCWLNVIIGARQVGKTYGVTKDLLDRGQPFMFMRRTSEELAAICGDPDLDPWIKLDREGYQVRMAKVSGSKTYAIGDINPDTGKIENRRGMGISLSTVATVRGFSGDQYTDLIFDEFIPEEFVVVRKSMGDAFVNALKTIGGNRELEGRPSLTVWLLANANSIQSPILQSLNLLDDLDGLIREDKEWTITENRVFLAMPRSDQITSMQKNTPLMRQIQGGSAYDMMVNNTFAYDDLGKVKRHSLTGWQPYLNIGKLGIWSSGTHLYVTTTRGKASSYLDTDDEIKRCDREHPEIRLMYLNGYVTFYSTKAFLTFKDYIKI